ncbi:MAG: type III-B CRISPR module RAMP protein Cmr6 [Ktedonobacteraceae bacterium]|nr:type III-B CRISPR module RAMP protein Cmr6 [Ktedonobacteraceae bacterium]
MTYYLPASIARLIEQGSGTCRNMALLLDKYVTQEVISGSKEDGKEKGEKGKWLRELVSQQHKHIDIKLAENAYRRWLAMVTALKATTFQAELDWRMVVGLGGETVLETDITLHHLYGIPYIPGSALKGLTRAYVAGEEKAYFIPSGKSESERKPSLKEETDHEDLQRIFGSQKQAGTVIFFDALPLNGKATFALDIMNPHYPDYYRSLSSSTPEAPTNDQSPNPIPFLTVTDTVFTFALAPRNSASQQHKNDVQLVTGWLRQALQDYGIGGKTSAGYGYFQHSGELSGTSSSAQASPASPTENSGTPTHQDGIGEPSSSPSSTIDPELKQAQGYIRELEALKSSDVAGQIYSFYQRWQQLKNEEARKALAQAIITTVRQAGREKKTAEKAWYQELLSFLERIQKER